MSILKEFDNAIAKITEERGKIYGHPEDNFRKITEAADILGLDIMDDPAISHALRMILVKISRLTETPNHLDSVIDIVGYARTIAMILERYD